MRRTPPAQPVRRVHVIHPDAVYFEEDLRRWLRFRADTLRAEVAAGRLRVSRRAGRYYVLGKWLLAWIEAGLVESRPIAPQEGARP